MSRLVTRIRCFFEARLIRFKESDYDFVQLHLGTNSIVLLLGLIVMSFISMKFDVLDWSYLKGFHPELAFLVGLFSVVFGVSFYKYWQLGEKSIYSVHLAKTRFLPHELNAIFAYKDFRFGIGSRLKLDFTELTSFTRQALSVLIFANLALITLDNAGYDKLAVLPVELAQTKGKFCPVKEDAEEAPPKEGCELVVRAHELGYAKDLGVCAPDAIEASKMTVCEDRRADEPYFHYFVRLLTSSVKDIAANFRTDKLQQVRDKFGLQFDNVVELKAYQTYALSASPRASHHIWTNLPYPENYLVKLYREQLKPNYCLEMFQNQTNTVEMNDDDIRRDSKVLEHVFGQLLFNPRTKLTVGYCREYKIHWDSPVDTCDRLAQNPEAVLKEYNAYADATLVLRRHDIANIILSLDEEIRALEPAAQEHEVDDTDSVAPGSPADAVAPGSADAPAVETDIAATDADTAIATTGAATAIFTDAKNATAATDASGEIAVTDAGSEIAATDMASELASLDEPDPEFVGETSGKAGRTRTPERKVKGKIVVTKIAKLKQQIRPKNELVSFHCFMQVDQPTSRTAEHKLELQGTLYGVKTGLFMQVDQPTSRTAEHKLELQGTLFAVKTRFFPKLPGKGETQIAMYSEFSKLLDDRFHYSQFSSRSDMDIEGARSESEPNAIKLEQPDYLFSRLEMLANVDIFLGNNWVLERDDLLGVYPYHVHLRNYVESFRKTYQGGQGRL